VSQHAPAMRLIQRKIVATMNRMPRILHPRIDNGSAFQIEIADTDSTHFYTVQLHIKRANTITTYKNPSGVYKASLWNTTNIPYNFFGAHPTIGDLVAITVTNTTTGSAIQSLFVSFQ